MKKLILFCTVLLFAGCDIAPSLDELQGEEYDAMKTAEQYFEGIIDFENLDGQVAEAEIVAIGDINQDGVEDAIVELFTCGASCGFSYNIFINDAFGNTKLVPNGDSYGALIMGSGAAKTQISKVEIVEGKIIFTGYGFGEKAYQEELREIQESHAFTIQNGVLEKEGRESCGLMLLSHQEGEGVSFPLTLSGVVDTRPEGCRWIMFEGQAGTVRVFHDSQPVSNISPVRVDNWMTQETSFEVQLELDENGSSLKEGDILKIVFLDDNAAGIPELQSRREYEFFFQKTSEETMDIELYVPDIEVDPCDGLKKIIVSVPRVPTVADSSLKYILQNYLSELAPFYEGIVIEDEVASVSFSQESLAFLNSPACMQRYFKGPIEETLKQYPSVREVQYKIDGELYDLWDA